MVKHHQGYRGELPGIISEHLEGLEFPAGKGRILSHLNKSELDRSLLREFEGLPDRDFEDMREVLDHFTGGTMSIDAPGETGEEPPGTGDESLTGLRKGKPLQNGVGSRNIRDNLGDGASAQE